MKPKKAACWALVAAITAGGFSYFVTASAGYAIFSFFLGFIMMMAALGEEPKGDPTIVYDDTPYDYTKYDGGGGD